jgi:hypothetical protein
MFIWIIAALVFISLGIVGYYQGVVRVAFSLVGLLVGALLALPLSGVFASILKLFGLEHPVLLAFLAPFCVYLLILILFKAGGLAAHRKVDTYFKYKASDTLRMLFNRLNARVGICVGMLNAMVYVVLIGVVVYTVGYFTLQVSTSEKDSFWLKAMNRLAVDLRSTQLDKAVAGFVPKSERYFDGADIAASIFLNPLLQNRLSTYPVFLTLNEKPEFKQIGSSTEFQSFWTRGPTIQEFRSHNLIRPVVESGEWYNKFVTMLDGDFKDLKTYLETGKSPKYEDEHILGRWEFDGAAAFALAKKRKPVMPLQEVRGLRVMFSTVFKGAVLTATVDKRIILKVPGVTKLLAGLKLPAAAAQNLKDTGEGTWEPGKSGGYVLSLSEGGKNVMKVDALVEGNRLTFNFAVPGRPEGVGLVFEK